MSLELIREQLNELASYVRPAYRNALEAAELTEVRAFPLAVSTLVGSTSATGERITANLATASASLYEAFGALSNALDAIEAYRQELR